jgi:hypothetical protein
MASLRRAAVLPILLAVTCWAGRVGLKRSSGHSKAGGGSGPALLFILFLSIQPLDIVIAHREWEDIGILTE